MQLDKTRDRYLYSSFFSQVCKITRLPTQKHVLYLNFLLEIFIIFYYLQQFMLINKLVNKYK